MKELCSGLEKVLAFVCGLLLLIMVADVLWQVVSRYLVKSPSSFTEELARFLLLWIGMLGAAYAYRKNAHLGLDLLVNKLQGCQRVAADRLATSIVLLFALLVMVVGGIKIVWFTLTLEQISPALQVKMGYVYSVIPISGLLFCLFTIDKLLQPTPPSESNLHQGD